MIMKERIIATGLVALPVLVAVATVAGIKTP